MVSAAWAQAMAQQERIEAGIRYAWIIEKDHLFKPDDDPSDNEAGTSGPSDATEEEIARAKKEGTKFRILDDDGVLYYSGRIWHSEGTPEFEPLDDFGTPNAGATEIQYRSESGAWESL